MSRDANRQPRAGTGDQTTTTTKQSIPMVSVLSSGGTYVARLRSWLFPVSYTPELVAILERVVRLECAMQAASDRIGMAVR